MISVQPFGCWELTPSQTHVKGQALWTPFISTNCLESLSSLLVNLPFILLVLVIGGTILFLCIPLIFIDATKERGPRRVLPAIGAMLLAIGIMGFFGSALSSLGGLNWLGQDFEWPAGFSSGVITTKDSLHIVPHTPSGRIQLYDSNWKFLKGWHVDAGGGTFRLLPLKSNVIEVVTARAQWHYTFTMDGNVISRRTYEPASYSDFPEAQEAYFVPTSPLLWVFSHPFLSWGTAAFGGVLLAIHDKLKKKARRKSPSTKPAVTPTSQH